MTPINALVPEFSVRNYPASRAFYRDVLGFEIAYERPHEGFGMFVLGQAQLMLDQIGLGRDFAPAGAQQIASLGRGVNVQILVDELNPLLQRLSVAAVIPDLVETRNYRMGDIEAEQYQCVVADPDGHLLRFAQILGHSPI